MLTLFSGPAKRGTSVSQNKEAGVQRNRVNHRRNCEAECVSENVINSRWFALRD